MQDYDDQELETTMLRLRQSYLGASPQGSLCLVRRPQRPLPEPQGECFISRLPDELLIEIFEYLSPDVHRYDPENPIRVPLVSQQWERVYNHVLYRKIRLGDSSVQKRIYRSRLATVLQQRPHLCDYVQDVHIDLRLMSAASLTVAGILASCKAIRRLSLTKGWLTPALVTPEATGALPRLEYLQLSGYANGLLFMAVLAYFAVPTLKKIALDRYEEWATENLELSAGWVSEENPSTLIDRALDYVRTPAIPSVHLRNLTTLTLSGPVAQPLVTEAITKWPARLLKFSLHGILHSNCAEQYTLSAVQQILNLHRESLQDIRLGIIPGGGQDIPDFSAFSDLQRLRLNTFNLMGISPLEASRKLAAPSLSYLHIEFETEDQHPEQVEDFATYEVRWLEEFVALLKPSGDTATSKLEKIFVGFLPIFALWYFPSTDDAPWPWDYLDEAAQVVTKRGVTLNYTTPTCTREDWDRMLSAKRNGETWPPEKEYEETDNEDELDSDEDDVDDEDDDDDESDNDN